MRSLPTGVLLLLAALAANAQSPAGCTSPESHQLDFWVGEWNLAHAEDGKAATSHNRITRTLDGCAILEEFDGRPDNPLVGRSLSMYDARAKRSRGAGRAPTTRAARGRRSGRSPTGAPLDVA